MQTVNGTTYKDETPKEVIDILERYRQSRSLGRLRLFYGSEGRAWGDVEEGYIGRSMGGEKIPLLIKNSRSMGGGGILDHCIVKIETAKGKRLLWKHPQLIE